MTETNTPAENVFVPTVKFQMENETLLGRVMRNGEETCLIRTISAIYSVPKDQVEPLV